MATYTKYEPFIENLINEVVDAFGTTDTFRAVIHTDAPTVATDDQLADLTQITGTGYPGTNDIQNDSTRTGGTVTMTAVDVVWTATAADWTGTAQYVSIYDDTAAGDELMCSFNYGTTFAVGNGETFTLNFGASLATFA
jgi:hypothetical protein